MIEGIGIDLLDIPRMSKNIANERFMVRVFTSIEREYIFSRGVKSIASAAGIFCAKEAVMKAVGDGLAIPLTDVEVYHDARGKPFVRLLGATAERMRGCAVHLSITHTDSTACAFAVIERKEAI